MNNNKTWIDKNTNLMWQFDIDKERVTFDEAIDYIEKLNDKKFAGFDDWKIPTIDELMTISNIPLYDRRKTNQQKWLDWYKETKKLAKTNEKSNTKVSYIKDELLDSMTMDWQGFWSCNDSEDDDENYAWMALFGNGSINSYLKNDAIYLRCVRDNK
jgi:hypothetical protein